LELLEHAATTRAVDTTKPAARTIPRLRRWRSRQSTGGFEDRTRIDMARTISENRSYCNNPRVARGQPNVRGDGLGGRIQSITSSGGDPVSFYQEQLLPRFQDKVMARRATREVRARVCSGLRGAVVEIGFGTGLNARYYPPEVDLIHAVEPSRVCMRLAEPRIAESTAKVELAGLTGERLDLPSDAFDAVLSTWTLCTIPDMAAALGEIRRVLKPGGSFHFVEHGHAPDPGVARWQQRIEPLNKRLAGGCHLTRRIPDALGDAGFHVDQLDTYYISGEPKVFGHTFEGRATK